MTSMVAVTSTYTQLQRSLNVRSGPALRGLATSLGDLYLQDAYGVYDSQYSNSGCLEVEPLSDD
jgi:hypothetical protein